MSVDLLHRFLVTTSVAAVSVRAEAEPSRLDLAYDVREAAKFAGVGWLRATATVRLKLLSSGVESTSYSNQLVVFGPEAGSWKIRSYLSAPAPADVAR